MLPIFTMSLSVDHLVRPSGVEGRQEERISANFARKFTQISPVEQNDSPPPIKPLFGSPGMKLWLLIALNFGCYGVFILLARLDFMSWLAASPETSTSMMGKLSNGFFTLVIFLVPALVFANAVLPDRFHFYKLHRKVNALPVVLAVVAILSSVFFIDILGTWNANMITDPKMIADNATSEIYGNWVSQMPGVGDLLVFLFASALIPAIAEELFFRGGVQQLMQGTLRNKHAAILLSAFFFSLMHMDMFAFLPRFILGIALGYLFLWSGSLRLSMVAHFVYNAFSILSLYYTQHYPESWWAKAETTYVMGAISLVVSVGALLTCRNLLRKNVQHL
jgi:membrane protease YdiL (CAAX protease family)